MKPYLNTLHRFQVVSRQHRPRYLHRINMLARRESVCKVTQRVIFVVVHNGITKIYRISGIFTKSIEKFHQDPMTAHLHFGCLILRRRNNHLLRCLVQLDVFIEFNGNFLALVVRGIGFRRSTHKLRRCFIIRSPVGHTRARACIKPDNDQQQSNIFRYRFHLYSLVIQFQHFFNIVTAVAQARHFVLATQLSFLFQPVVEQAFTSLDYFQTLQGNIFMPFGLII